MIKNLVVSESEQYPKESKQHYLYSLVPASVQIKVAKFLESDIDPILFDKEQQELLDDLLSDADILLFPDKKNFPKVKEIYDALTDAIAKLAFVPYGVEIFGYRYEVI
jgi:hypothetical protein